MAQTLNQNRIDFQNPKWRFEQRVKNLMDKGRTREEAEKIVKFVITYKEQD